MKSGTGYTYTYDENGKIISLARKLMAEKLGRPLQGFEKVSYKDGDKGNCTPDNLYLVLMSGTPIDKLVCTECGAHGSIQITS